MSTVTVRARMITTTENEVSEEWWEGEDEDLTKRHSNSNHPGVAQVPFRPRFLPISVERMLRS